MKNKFFIKIVVISITGIGILFLMFYSGVFLYFQYLETHFICSHPKYEFIYGGLNKDEIIKILGELDKKIIKSDVNEYRFGQGELEYKIKEAWIYKFFGWDGKIEIYFNEDGIVIGKNCGHG
ncbi:hypothetical protein KAS41_02935 [Candidatus Parcubacteria bacterium]|nr:hypothetical protein [Candidatus Parcubacteria bacterium]